MASTTKGGICPESMEFEVKNCHCNWVAEVVIQNRKLAYKCPFDACDFCHYWNEDNTINFKICAVRNAKRMQDSLLAELQKIQTNCFIHAQESVTSFFGGGEALVGCMARSGPQATVVRGLQVPVARGPQVPVARGPQAPVPRGFKNN